MRVVQLYVVILFSILTGIAFRGSKVLFALYALHLGASPATIGVLAAAYSVFPLLLAVHAGRVADRHGVRYSLLFGSVGLAAALALPYAVPGLATLFVAAALLGFSHIFYHVAIHYAVGEAGGGAARAKNFGTFSLGGSIAAFVGPAATGFSIDHLGYAVTCLVLAATAAVPAVTLCVARSVVPAHLRHHAGETPSKALDLLRHPPLLRVFLMSAVVLTGLELFTFYVPIYGHSVGASASQIGLVLASYAAAAFVVRLVMPRLVRQHGEARLLAMALLLSGITYLLFPLFTNMAMLAGIAFALGLGLGLGQPLTITLTYERSPAGRSGEALGLRLTANKITQLAIPLLFGTLGSAFGVFPVFWANAAFLAASGAFALRGERGRTPLASVQASRQGDDIGGSQGELP